jgi:hypothetical protein
MRGAARPPSIRSSRTFNPLETAGRRKPCRARPIALPARDMVSAMHKPLLAAAMVLLLAATAVSQTAKPDFSGTWTLDLAKSDFGQMPAPQSVVYVVEHKEPNVKISSTQVGEQGEMTNVRNISTDGKENTNTMRAMGSEQEMKSTTTWDANKLVTSLKVAFQGTPVEIVDSWDLSADGKVLTISRQFKTAQGDFAQKTVFNKK